jgi:outer membrane protein OmpA-like peptidoglycan-associated protein
MNDAKDILNGSKSLVAVAVASVLIASCAVAPVRYSGADEARAKLTRLQSNPDLANRAPAAIAEAEAAVRLAEQPPKESGLGEYRVYIADRKVEIATAQAQTRFYEDQHAALEAQQQNARLDARTREVEVARDQTAQARADDETQRLVASQARSDADAARDQTAQARADDETQRLVASQARSDADAANATSAALADQAVDLQRQIDALDLQVTNRGLVLTLGDVLFATGGAELLTGAAGHLDKLVDFLKEYTDRTVLIEGYTDSTGTQTYNQDLSERRAESVRGYLSAHGVAYARLSASGRGMNDPVSSNDSATGRQQNRRVEVIVSNPTIASR